MVSTLNLEEKYNRVRRNFCFYLDIQDHGLARSISRRIQDMGLQQEVFLTSRVTHVVVSSEGVSGAGAGAGGASCARADRRADAMLQRVRAHQPSHAARNCVHLTVQKAISLLDKLYDTFFTAPRKAHVRFFTKHFIKIEFLDKVCRPVYKEFDEWPEISLEPDPPREKKEKKESSKNQPTITNQNLPITTGQKMTRKSRPRIKDKEEKEQKAGYCEMCNADYVDAALHRRSPHHLAFVRDHTNFLALDSLISSGADVTTFLDKASVNGERRSLRKMCNGDVDQPKTKRSKRSQSPDSMVNGDQSPRRNGGLDEERRHNTRCAKKIEQLSEDRQYYKVVGVSTKLRSSGGFATKRKDSPPACNGTKPLVVKFRKVRRSELSVLSDEAEQFMFPKRASSTSSTSSDEEDEKEVLSPKRKSPAPPPPPVSTERRRQARPVALKEESSEEDSWPEDIRRRKRRVPPVAKRGRRPGRPPNIDREIIIPPPVEDKPAEVTPKVEPEVNPLREEPVEKCMKWEDGKLKYTPAVEQLEFAFESVPRSEPWFETFRRQDQDKIVVKNIPQYFELYSKSAPKLPYEIGQLPPLKPNCCPLSDLVIKKEEKPGPSRAYGTRGMKKQRIRKRTAAILALESHPRKSPREHASTLAILGSAGLLNRRKHADDNKSTASEDTVSDTQSNPKVEPVASETQEASERLQQFLSEVFEDAAEFDMSEDVEGEAAVITSANMLDVSSLVSECEDCDIIRNEIKAGVNDRVRGRRGKFKKKNRTGWPNKKKIKKDSRNNSSELEKAHSSLDRSSAEPMDDDTTQSTISEEDPNQSDPEKTLVEEPAAEEAEESLQLDLKVVVQDEQRGSAPAESGGDDSAAKSESASGSCAPASEEEREARRRRRALAGLLLQPVVRVARVDPAAHARTLRSQARAHYSRSR